MSLIDLHCDTIWKLMESGDGQSLLHNTCSVSIPEMKKAGIDVQFFACFVLMEQFQGAERFRQGYEYAMRMIARLEEETARCRKDIGIAKTMREIERNREEKRISAVLTLEEGGIIDGDAGKIDALYARGIRLITLLWNHENFMGYPNSRDAAVMQKGLKPFGFETVERMNELGMIVDVSHMSDGGFRDVIAHSTKPVAATHSNARAICPHPRNLSDDMIRALAEKGGVMGLNFYPYFVRETGKASVEDLARHIKHIVNVGGIEVAAIGTDFDGFDGGETEIGKTGEMEKLCHALRKEGFTESRIEKICSGNAERLMREILA